MIEKNSVLSSRPNPRIVACQLIDKVWLTSKIIRLRIANHNLSRFSFPGQFVNIKISDNYFPLLRRPFSIHRVNRQEDWFELLVQVIGKGTALLADFAIGAELDILGPLGNHFVIPQDHKQAILIAGGLGIAPLLFLSQELTQHQLSTTLFFGNRTNDGFCCLEDFEELDISYFLATEDGSLDFKGKVTDLVLAKAAIVKNSPSVIYACGPNPMLQRVKEIAAQLKLSCQVSLETMMACGFGVCLGCVVKSTSPVMPYKYVCNDGPVFDSTEIDLSD